LFSQHLGSHEGSILSLRTGNIIEKASRLKTVMKGIEELFGVASDVPGQERVREEFQERDGIRLLESFQKSFTIPGRPAPNLIAGRRRGSDFAEQKLSARQVLGNGRGC
jgi:hypothetical protein